MGGDQQPPRPGRLSGGRRARRKPRPGPAADRPGLRPRPGGPQRSPAVRSSQTRRPGPVSQRAGSRRATSGGPRPRPAATSPHRLPAAPTPAAAARFVVRERLPRGSPAPAAGRSRPSSRAAHQAAGSSPPDRSSPPPAGTAHAASGQGAAQRAHGDVVREKSAGPPARLYPASAGTGQNAVSSVEGKPVRFVRLIGQQMADHHGIGTRGQPRLRRERTIGPAPDSFRQMAVTEMPPWPGQCFRQTFIPPPSRPSPRPPCAGPPDRRSGPKERAPITGLRRFGQHIGHRGEDPVDPGARQTLPGRLRAPGASGNGSSRTPSAHAAGGRPTAAASWDTAPLHGRPRSPGRGPAHAGTDKAHVDDCNRLCCGKIK